MITIDEAIAKEEKYIAVNKDKYEFECRYYGKDTVERGPKLDCVNEYEYHMKIVELLEDLKKRRNADEGYLADIYQDIGYNKAIDDFAEKLKAKCDGIIKDKWNSNVAPVSWAEAYADFKDDIDEIAEQLKAGGADETVL